MARDEKELGAMIEDAVKLCQGTMQLDLRALDDGKAAAFERLLHGRHGVKTIGIVIATDHWNRSRVR